MPPKFSYQSILDYHHSRVEMLEMELAILNQQYQEIERNIERLSNRKNRLYEELAENQEGELDMKLINHLRNQIDLVNHQIEDQRKQKAQIEVKMRAKQEEVVAAKKEEAVFEKLKEKEMTEWTEKMDQIEKETISDIYISQAFRQISASGTYGDNY